MIDTIEEFELQLNDLDPVDNAFVLRTDELVGELAPAVAKEAYVAILRFFERFPNADCGAPGTLVHLMEHYYPNYVAALIASVQARPSYNGVLMINRILNTNVDESLRLQLLAALKSVETDDRSVSPHVREMVQRFLARHA